MTREGKQCWVLAVVASIGLALCVRWYYVVHRTLKTLDKRDEYDRLVVELLKELDVSIEECLPLIPLAQALGMYQLRERVKSAMKLFVVDKEDDNAAASS